MLNSCTENMNQLIAEGTSIKDKGQQVRQSSDQQRPGAKCEYTTAVVIYMYALVMLYNIACDLQCSYRVSPLYLRCNIVV